MFLALPGVRGAPLIMPVEFWRTVSRHIWELGARPTGKPVKEWVAPKASDPNWTTSPGRWVPVGSGPQLTEDEEARRAVDRMSLQQRAELRVALERWEVGDPLPESPSGVVANTLTEHQRLVVLKVLRGQ